MSAIDIHKYEVIGLVRCPSDEPFVYQNDTREIPIYLFLDENIDNDWDAKKGDLLIGGGAGEAPAFRISLPEAIQYFTDIDWDVAGSHSRDDIFKAFWTINDAYIFGTGYRKDGWKPPEFLESWIA